MDYLNFKEIFANLGDWTGGALVGLLLSGFITVLVRISAWRSGRNIVKALTGFSSKNLPLAIAPVRIRSKPGTAAVTKDPHGLPLIGYGPFSAYAVISGYLLSIQSKTGMLEMPEIVTSDQYQYLSERQKAKRSLLLIGYSASNEATKILEPLMKLPVCFAPNNLREIISVETKEKLVWAEYIEEKGSKVNKTIGDSGLVVKVKHPLNEDETILYLAGCETFGVKIAAESLIPENIPDILGLSKISATTWKHSFLPTLSLSKAIETEFVAIFSSDVNHLTTGRPELKYAWIRDSNRLEYSWKQTYPRK